MNLLRELPLRDTAGNYLAVVETPGGSGVKLKYDPELRSFLWSRPLSVGVCFPYDYGFLPQTIADDGDAVDVLVYSDTPSHAGVVIPSRVIGALRVEQQRPGQRVKRNDRVILVPASDHRGKAIRDVADVPERVRDELEAFFRASLALTGKQITFRGWAGAAEAEALIAAAATRWKAA